ncbi:hypothetical protein H6CHR_00045 [Variovorax sp. PBL-H6]|uniref:hypothetical protein n=1 Tax=Variovorax sp. PBL-H6 TaxID=434009 RepID=UPI001316304E|nr:hypothetical protein [Variovorax sp. PBL-H6]VTU14878.1 hypothetical protein H6CHR_00045 [Variovorax sp. PBL-H6]
MPIKHCTYACAAALAAWLALPTTASAQNGNDPPAAQRAHTLKPPPQNGKVLGGIHRGSDAAGRGIDHADSATRRGIGNASERASRPIRNLGESLGRKLPGGQGRGAQPSVGPQGTAP